MLVTRPARQGERTAAGLRALGHEPLLLPLTRTLGLPVAPKPEWFACDAVAVTSGNALRGLAPEFLEGLIDKRCYAVGAATWEAAEAAGFGDVQQGPGDAAGLAALIASEAGRGISILYLCGRVRGPGFEAALAQAGCTVIAAETYDTVPLAVSEAALVEATQSAVGAVLLCSGVAAEAFVRLAARPEAGTAFAGSALLCLSPRIAATLPDPLRKRARVAAAPTEEALLSLLEPR